MDLSQSEYLTHLAILRCEKYARPANRLVRAQVLNQPTSHAHEIFLGLQGQNACVLITTACRRVVGGDSVDNVASKELAPEAGVALVSVARPCLHGLHLCQGTSTPSSLSSLLSLSPPTSPRSSAQARPLRKRSPSPGLPICFFFDSPLHTWRGHSGRDHHQHRHRQFPSKKIVCKIVLTSLLPGRAHGPLSPGRGKKRTRTRLSFTTPHHPPALQMARIFSRRIDGTDHSDHPGSRLQAFLPARCRAS